MAMWNPKCRFFDERYACDTLASEGYNSCEECRFSSEYSKKILIIKLGAMGDVLRTTSILPALKEKYGDDVFVYWLTNSESTDLLKNNHLIDKILDYNFENLLRLQQEKFDILFSLEIDNPATLIATLVEANEKFGYYFDNGVTSCFNKGAESYLKTAFLHHAKSENRRTYQDLLFEACNLEYKKQKPIFNFSDEHYNTSKKFIEENRLSENDKVIGINIGSASRWPSKFWNINKIKLLMKELSRDFKIILLAGPNEEEKQKKLIEEANKEGIFLIGNNPNNSLNEFASIVNICDTIICGDTLILHLATALNKQTICLFFVTSPWEIEDYGIITKIISPLLHKYFYTNEYTEELADSISLDEVVSAVNLKNANK